MNMELANLVNTHAENLEMQREVEAKQKAQKKARIQYFLVYGTLILLGYLAIAHIG